MATTYYVRITSGDDGNAGTSHAEAWQHLYYARQQVVAGDKVYVQAEANYTDEDTVGGSNDCVLYIVTAGTNVLPIVWEGYHTSAGDGGIVTIDADASTLGSAAITAIGGNVYNVFKYFRFTGGSSHGFSMGNDDANTFKYCRFDNNDGAGLEGDRYLKTFNCLFDNNGSNGFDSASYGCILVNCISHTNNGYNYLHGSDGCSMFGCLSYSCGGGGYDDIRVGGGDFGHLIANCTIDGDGNPHSGHAGIYVSSATSSYAIINNILFDCYTGIDFSSDDGDLIIVDNNLFYSNTADRNNVITGDNDVSGTGDPFTDSGSRDYTLTSSSEAKMAGTDVSYTKAYWASFIGGTNPPSGMDAYMDIGATQREEPAGGSGGAGSLVNAGLVQ